MNRLLEPLRTLGEAVISAVVWIGLMALGSLLLVAKFMTSRAGVWILRGFWAGVYTYCWYQFVRDYGIRQFDDLADTPTFRFGVLISVTVMWVIVAPVLFQAARRETKKPLPIDRTFPPTRMVYLQGEEETPLCVCHGKPVKDKTEIFYWPQPAKFVCTDQSEAS
jgi:hypothetical protein